MNNHDNIQPIDYSELLSGYEGKWVVISEDKKRVLASGKSLRDISEKANEGFVMRVPESDAAFAPWVVK